MESLNRRTNSNNGVAFEYSDRVLAVGARTAVLDDVSDRSEVLRTYFDLVNEQRSAPLASRIDVRDRDLVSLAAILDLPPDELERYIDRELARFVEASPAEGRRRDALAPGAPPATRKLRIGLLMVGAGALAAAGATAFARLTASAQPASPSTVATPAAANPAETGAGTVRIEPDPNGTGTLVITDTPPVPAAADGTEIGGAQQIVREPLRRSPR